MMKKKLVIVSLVAVVAVGSALASEHIVGGTGYTGNTIPWWGTYTAGRFQCCWFQSEINEAGDVTKVEFQFHSYSGTPPTTFNSVDMLLCHTSLGALTSNYSDNYAGNTPVTVYTGDFTVPSGLSQNDWLVQFETTTTLTYNNSDNLLFEISWNGRSASVSNYFWRANAGQPGRLWATSKTATTGTLYASQGEIARVTITPDNAVQPTSLGRVKAIYR